MRKLIFGLCSFTLLFAASAAHGVQALTADRVQETTTITGTGTITLAGAVTGYRTFAAAFSTGNLIQYAIVSDSGTEWEVGNGTLATTTTLSRDTIVASSNSGSATNFSAGGKKIFATLHGAWANATLASGGDISANRATLAAGDSGGIVVGSTLMYVTAGGLVVFVDPTNTYYRGIYALSLGTSGDISANGVVTTQELRLTPGAVGSCGSGDKGHARVAADGTFCTCNGTVWTPTPATGTCS